MVHCAHMVLRTIPLLPISGARRRPVTHPTGVCVTGRHAASRHAGWCGREGRAHLLHLVRWKRDGKGHGGCFFEAVLYDLMRVCDCAPSRRGEGAGRHWAMKACEMPAHPLRPHIIDPSKCPTLSTILTATCSPVSTLRANVTSLNFPLWEQTNGSEGRGWGDWAAKIGDLAARQPEKAVRFALRAHEPMMRNRS